MKAKKTIYSNIEKQLNKTNEDADVFYSQAIRYIKAIKEGRVVCNIESVSRSGMTRNLYFTSCEGSVKNGFNYCGYFFLFKSLGFSRVKNSHSFRISGCGMDMVFHTNYTIMHDLKRLGFITEKQCSGLAQRTPSVI